MRTVLLYQWEFVMRPNAWIAPIPTLRESFWLTL
jgi:hypothetical protein